MTNKKILNSWKEISFYINRSQRTCYRWEKELELPINRIDDNSTRSKVFAFQSEIDQWLRNKANNRKCRKQNLGISENHELIFAREPASAIQPFEDFISPESNHRFSEKIINEVINKFLSAYNFKIHSALSEFQLKIIEPLLAKLSMNFCLKANAEIKRGKIFLKISLTKLNSSKILWELEFKEGIENSIEVLKNVFHKLKEK